MKRYIAVICLLMIALSCDDNTVVNRKGPADDTPGPYSAIISTDENGVEITDKSADDWFPQCYEIPGFNKYPVCCYPAYPNPAGDAINFKISPSAPLTLKIWISDKPGNIIDTVFSETIEGRSPVFTFDRTFNGALAEPLADGYYRMHYSVRRFADTAAFVSYGDIRFSKQGK